eukprot:TRINITY_DN40197_c0_g1_i1.p1 TRINITY_DN40197_c0_g1~~TRINITY_DN40197_c0_g1_i1.p1  ORF type:complete len:213 (-),score=39.39 TRINITY_DN40197_c0_g1_i1:15-653(-)
MMRDQPRSTLSSSSAASDVYKRQRFGRVRASTVACLAALFITSLSALVVWGGRGHREFLAHRERTGCLRYESWQEYVDLHNAMVSGRADRPAFYVATMHERDADIATHLLLAMCSGRAIVASWFPSEKMSGLSISPDVLPARVNQHRRRAVRTEVIERDLSLIHISEPTRLLSISYAVFCLKKKKKKQKINKRKKTKINKMIANNEKINIKE